MAKAERGSPRASTPDPANVTDTRPSKVPRGQLSWIFWWRQFLNGAPKRRPVSTGPAVLQVPGTASPVEARGSSVRNPLHWLLQLRCEGRSAPEGRARPVWRAFKTRIRSFELHLFLSSAIASICLSLDLLWVGGQREEPLPSGTMCSWKVGMVMAVKEVCRSWWRVNGEGSQKGPGMVEVKGCAQEAQLAPAAGMRALGSPRLGWQ